MNKELPDTASLRVVKRVALVSSGPPLSLKVLYCLHALGLETDVIDIAETSIAKYSRYRRRYVRLPISQSPPAAQSSEFAESLRSYIEANHIDAVIGADIAATGLIHATKDHLHPALFFPSVGTETLNLLDDKWRFQQFLVENGIPAPRSILLEAANDLDARLTELKFPAVVKPLHGESGHGIVSLQDIAQLRRHLQSGSRYARLPLLLQEYAVGQDADLSFLAEEGEILCHVLHTRTDGCELNFVSNKSVLEVAASIARACNYTGVANVDVRIDQASGAIQVLECNPRFWYTLQASLWRGLNFVEAGFLQALGQHPQYESFNSGRYRLHGCLVKRLLTAPWEAGSVAAYNWRGLLQAMTDPLPFIAERLRWWGL